MRKLPVLMVAIAVAAVSVGVVAAHAVTSSNTVAVRLNEFNVNPAVQGAKAGNVTFVLRNTGKAEHEFVVLKTVKAAGALAGKNGEANEAGNVGEVGSVKPGQLKKLTLTLAKGHYSLICNLPGHYAGGQFADFYVR
jgi:uncharacterized cupredoxin-like copper-binding protein